MKKGIILLILLIMVIILCGCGKPENDGRFIEVYRASYFNVVVDMETGVEYIRQFGGGGVCPLVDSYGNPYVYPAFDAREDALQGRSE